jgi:hypothetical protein
MRPMVMNDAMPMAASGIMYRKTEVAVESAAGGAAPPEAPIKIRKEFPESWICDDLDFEALGLVFSVEEKFSRVLHFVFRHSALSLCFHFNSHSLCFHQRIKSLRCPTL